MNNKQLGTAFERRVCEIFKNIGFWVHFFAPDSRGAQPFDIIAVKNGDAFAIECKTLDLSKHWFTIDRIEENQRTAFDYWMKCGNNTPMIFVDYGDEIVVIPWDELKAEKKIDIRELKLFNAD